MKSGFLYVFVFLGYVSCGQSLEVFRGKLNLHISTGERKVKGSASYKFHCQQDSFAVNARKMHIQKVLLNGKKNTPYTYDGQTLKVRCSQSAKNRIKIYYSAIPEKALYFVPTASEMQQSWTQGQGKNNSHWVPSFDSSSQKVLFDIRVTYPSDNTVISNGRFVKKKHNRKAHTTQWHYKVQHPMSSYLLAIVAGDYQKITSSTESRILIESYYYPSDSLKVAPTYQYTKQILGILEAEIGIPYPWSVYREVPVRDFIHGGMENTTITVFPDTEMLDEIGARERNIVEMSAHEVAHHWFGNMVTAKTSKDHWLQEGFATYYAMLVKRELFGEHYYIWDLMKTFSQLPHNNKALTDTNADAFTYYQKGALVLHLLRSYVGDEFFRKGVKSFLNHYKFSVADTDEFLKEMEKASGKNLDQFANTWIKSKDMDIESLRHNLMQYPLVQDYISLMKRPLSPMDTINSSNDPFYNMALIAKAKNKNMVTYHHFLGEALTLDDYELQSRVLQLMDSVPSSLRKTVEQVLEKQQYYSVTELALDLLCEQFPEDCEAYLAQTSNLKGFSNHSLRFTWLYYAIKYDFFSKKTDWIEELEGYTLPANSWLLRQQAFQTLDRLHLDWSMEVLRNLALGCVHHFFRFRDYCRRTLENSDLERTKLALKTIFHTLDDKAQLYLKTTFSL